MNRKFTIALTILAIIACTHAQLAGGFSQHSITEEAKSSALQVIGKTNESTSGKLKQFKNSRKKLVFYGTQVVAGINYGMVYKINSGRNAGKYECFKIYKALDGMAKTTYHGVARGLEASQRLCNLAFRY
jgi:hypothetical protein